MQNTKSELGSWKQEPLVWLLIAIPATAVVMGIVMLTLAIQSYSGLVVDDYYKKGKQINRVIARDRLAWELGLKAAMRLENGVVEIRFDPSVSHVPDDRIELSLVHATRPGLDQRLLLERGDTRLYRAPLELSGEGRWNVYLQTADWRITGSVLSGGAGEARLLPNYEPPSR